MSNRRTVRVRGKVFRVRGKRKVGVKEYLILNSIGRGENRRYQAFDPTAGPKGDLRQILVLPTAAASTQHLSVLHELSQGNDNLPSIIDYHPNRREISVVTEWVWGQPLDEYLRSAARGRVPWPSPTETCKRLRGLAHGLFHLHDRHNLIHGDIKPANLVLTQRAHRLVMVDFGSAWRIENTARRDRGDGLSCRYAAPEQLLGRSGVNFRCDQFSACVVIYEMLTGELPYARMGGMAGLPEYRALYEPAFEPPSRLAPRPGRLPKRVWRPIDRVIRTGLALDPGNRFQSPRHWLEVVDNLDLLIRGQGHVEFRALDRAVFRLFDLVGHAAGLLRLSHEKARRSSRKAAS